MNQVEIFRYIIGFRFGDYKIGFMTKASSGTKTRVNFDWETAFKIRRLILGFYHTHIGNPKPSHIDYLTMYAWTTALGKPLLCIIDGCGYFIPTVELVNKNNWTKKKIIVRIGQFIAVR